MHQNMALDGCKLAVNGKKDNDITICWHGIIINFFDIAVFLLSSFSAGWCGMKCHVKSTKCFFSKELRVLGKGKSLKTNNVLQFSSTKSVYYVHCFPAKQYILQSVKCQIKAHYIKCVWWFSFFFFSPEVIHIWMKQQSIQSNTLKYPAWGYKERISILMLVCKIYHIVWV